MKISQNTAPMMITPDPKRHQRIKDKERYHEERGDLLCEGCGKWHQQTSLCKECNACKRQACALYETCDTCQQQVCDGCVWKHVASHAQTSQTAQMLQDNHHVEDPPQQHAAEHIKRRRVTTELSEDRYLNVLKARRMAAEDSIYFMKEIDRLEGELNGTNDEGEGNDKPPSNSWAKRMAMQNKQ